MLNFMLVFEYCGKGYSHFYDDYNDAMLGAISVACGLGGEWQLYQWNKKKNCYEFLQS